ncbi:hypothetical protein ACRS6B_13860 [Nocardia asteroides]
MFFERRADELLLLLAVGEPTRQTLRDAFYAYGQIVEHPQFPAASAGIVKATQTTGTGTTAPDVRIAHGVRPVSRASAPSASAGLSRSIAESADAAEGSEGSSEQRRAR